MDRKSTGIGLTLTSGVLLLRVLATLVDVDRAPELGHFDRSVIDQLPAPSLDLTPLAPRDVPVIGAGGPATITLP